ncbi:MAG: hypothetical protein AABX30_03105 [Nanoarchaeota archaeon]
MKERWILLFAILLIIAVILIFSNSTKSYDLTNQFNLHGNVVYSGTTQDLSSSEFINKISQYYADNKKPNNDIYFIYGDKNKITVSNFEEIQKGKISVSLKNTEQSFQISDKKYSLQTIIPKSNNIDIILNNKKYNFELKDNEKVYFIIEEENE